MASGLAAGCLIGILGQPGDRHEALAKKDSKGLSLLATHRDEPIQGCFEPGHHVLGQDAVVPLRTVDLLHDTGERQEGPSRDAGLTRSGTSISASAMMSAWRVSRLMRTVWVACAR